jgi:hypothetical protein
MHSWNLGKNLPYIVGSRESFEHCAFELPNHLSELENELKMVKQELLYVKKEFSIVE